MPCSASASLDGSWNRLLAGEIANLAGSGSVFAIDQPDETLAARCAACDISPTGPLCGEGGMQPIGEAARVEIAVLAALDPLPARLGGAGMRAERRALVVRPSAFRHEFTADGLELEFELPRGRIRDQPAAGSPGGKRARGRSRLKPQSFRSST